MISTTLLGVAFCSCDFALRCPIPGWVAVETGARKRGRHGRFRSGVVRRDNCDCRARRERLRIQRPPHPPVDVARSTGVVGNLSGNCDCIRCWFWAFGGISMSVEYFACYVSNEAFQSTICSSFCLPCRRFADRPAESAVTRQRLGAGDAHRIYRRPSGNDTDVARDDRHRRIELLGQAHQAHDAVGPTRREATTDGLD